MIFQEHDFPFASLNTTSQLSTTSTTTDYYWLISPPILELTPALDVKGSNIAQSTATTSSSSQTIEEQALVDSQPMSNSELLPDASSDTTVVFDNDPSSTESH